MLSFRNGAEARAPKPITRSPVGFGAMVRSPFAARFLAPQPTLRSRALRQLLLLNGEDGAGLDLHTAHDAGAAARIGKLDIIETGLDSGDAQALVVVDFAVAVILALVRTPFLPSGERQVELLHRVGGEIPE